MAQYAQRAIDITISGSGGASGKSDTETFTLSGLRVQAVIAQLGGGVQAHAQILIYGLPQQMINNVTRFGMFGNVMTPNSIIVAAGDVGGAMSTVYTGEIWTAYGDYSAMPEVPLVITCQAALTGKIAPVGASSFNGPTDVATIMAGFAKQGGWAFKDGTPGGTKIILASPYFKGTLIDQIRSCALAANINYSIHNGILTIWGKGQSTDDDPILISPETGLVGYPSFALQGVVMTTLFNPNLVLGRKIKVSSSVTPACGTWNLYNIVHELSSQTPNGPWFSHIQAGGGVSNG